MTPVQKTKSKKGPVRIKKRTLEKSKLVFGQDTIKDAAILVRKVAEFQEDLTNSKALSI